MANSLFLITGCSGGGKSTLIEQLSKRGYHTVAEPGLRVIRSGGPRPWEDIEGFIKCVTELSRLDLERHEGTSEPTFFDRGLLDALSGNASRQKRDITDLMPVPFPYARPVFFAPPWPDIFEQTEERRLPLSAAINEADRLARDLDLLEMPKVELPRAPVEDRLHLVLQTIAA